MQDRGNWDQVIWPVHELSLAELGMFFYHLADLGYAVVSREDNPNVSGPACGSCDAFKATKLAGRRGPGGHFSRVPPGAIGPMLPFARRAVAAASNGRSSGSRCPPIVYLLRR